MNTSEGPSPRPLKQSLIYEEVQENRWHWCHEYEQCLLLACQGNWKSFTCAGCPLWEAEKQKKLGKELRG